MTGVSRSADASRDRSARLAAARLALRRAEESTGLYTGLYKGGSHGLPQGAGTGQGPGPGLWQYLGSCSVGVLHLQGSTALLLAAAALRQGSHGWCGILGGEELGWCAAAELGLDLSRVLHVPSGALEPCDVLVAAGALLDGVCVLLLGARAAESLAPAARRRLLGRARERGALVLSPVPWEGARTLVCELSHLGEEGSGATCGGTPDDVGADVSGEERGEADDGVVVPLRPQPALSALPDPAPGSQGTEVPAREVPGGYLRSLSWSLSDPVRGLRGTVVTHGPHGLRVREAASAAGRAFPESLRGAG